MSFQLQQASIAAELRKAGINPDAANRLAAILGNSVQNLLVGAQTQDLTPTAMRKITPHVRKYVLPNVDFAQGDPDYRQAQTQPSENKARPAQASTVRTDASPQQSETSYRVGQGEFTSVRSDGDKVSIGLRVRNTGSFVTQDPTSRTLIGRKLRAESNSGNDGKIRLSIQEAGPDTIFKLEVDEDAFGTTIENVADPVEEPNPLEPDIPAPECVTDEDCPEGQICINGECVDKCPPVACEGDVNCGVGCICEGGICVEAECGPDNPCPNGEICVNGRCVECTLDQHCPEGQVCIDGQCVADPSNPCAALQCGSSAECGPGCVCIAGVCVPRGQAFYCCYESAPVEGQAAPDAMCQLGPCFDGNGADAPDLTASGPYATYAECCDSGCGCRYSCVSGGCTEDRRGVYEGAAACLQLCDDGGGLGSCCETLAPNTSLNNTNCIIKRPAPGPCTMFRSGCPPEQRDGDNEVVIVRRWTAGASCDNCAETFSGACCLPDGTCAELCEGECEAQGGTFKGASWSDCETARTDNQGIYDFPCLACNGQGDCACEFDEKCEDRGSSAKCVPCGDDAYTVTDASQPTKAGISIGDTVQIYVKNCNSDGEEVTDREVECDVAGGATVTIDSEGELVADQDGSLNIKMTAAGNEAIVCVTIVQPDPPDPPPETSCTRCCHTYSADFTSPPSCPDGWTLALGDGDGDGIADAPSFCEKCDELPVGTDECNIDAANPAIIEIVDHVNGSADKLAEVTADDVLASGISQPSPHFECPDGKCYEGVFREEDCPQDNPLP